MLRKIMARRLLSMTRQEVNDTLTGKFILVFDDGELEVNAQQTVYSFYAWCYHVKYPKTPMLKKHHIKSIIKDGAINSKTHLKLIEATMWSTYDVMVQEIDHFVLIDDLTDMSYNITNDIYNDFSYLSEAHVDSIDILDFIQIATEPGLLAIQETLTPDKESIEKEHRYIIDNILLSKDKFPNNPICRMSRNALTKIEQVVQCVGSRGRLTDIDSNYFRNPIMRGFVRGMRGFHDILIESRSASKALSFSESPLEDAEYFSRRLRLLCMIVETVHLGDCGSNHYLTWHVKPKIVEGNNVIYQGDLETLQGKYYLAEDNTLQSIKSTDTFLEDKTIKIRSVIAGCLHPDPHGLCSVCFGEMYTSIAKGSNIGHQCATTMTEQTTQSVLSTKHSDVNSDNDILSIPPELKKYIDVTKDKLSYILPAKLKNSHIILSIQQEEAVSLTDLQIVDDVNDLSMTRVSSISEMGICIKGKTTNDKDDGVFVNVSAGKRKASFTYAMLRHIKEKGYITNEHKIVEIDMLGWDFNNPILTLPMKHATMSEHSSDLATIIESRVGDLKVRDSEDSPAAILVDFYDLVNSKLKVNLAVLEVIVYSSLCVNASQKNFDLPKPWTRKGAGVASYTIAGRSLSAAMDYENHRETISDPASFFSENRPSHICDAFLMPEETVKDM